MQQLIDSSYPSLQHVDVALQLGFDHSPRYMSIP
jgi:hypothetical protein